MHEPRRGLVPLQLLLPAQVLYGIGWKTDLYSGQVWRFVAAYLVLRAFYLVGAIIHGRFIQRPRCVYTWHLPLT